MSDTCGGKCCAVFTYSKTVEELRERASKQDLYIADMLIPLTTEEVAERVEEFDVRPADFDLVDMAEKGYLFYKCSHWDEETRLCKAYEDRPFMCRDYPYAKGCDHDCDCKYMAPPSTQGLYAAAQLERVIRPEFST